MHKIKPNKSFYNFRPKVEFKKVPDVEAESPEEMRALLEQAYKDYEKWQENWSHTGVYNPDKKTIAKKS